MDNCKVISAPISSSTYVDQDESGTPIYITKYRGILGKMGVFWDEDMHTFFHKSDMIPQSTTLSTSSDPSEPLIITN